MIPEISNGHRLTLSVAARILNKKGGIMKALFVTLGVIGYVTLVIGHYVVIDYVRNTCKESTDK
jgi:hypothetical protein